jgi:hypothetical protein
MAVLHFLSRGPCYKTAPTNTMNPSPRLLIVLVGVLLSVTVAEGATITVFSASDSGPGTLRQAIFDASSGDTINFAIQFPFPSSPREIQVSSELLINKNLTIEGPKGADKLTVRINAGCCGNGCPNPPRVLRIAPVSVAVTISGLTFAGAQNYCFPPGPGGGIVNTGTLTLDYCQVSGNAAQGDGGGIVNSGNLTIQNSTVSGNYSVSGGTSYGGGIANTGMLTLSNSTISGNSFSTGFAGGTPNFNGGGIANLNGGTLSVANSTIAGNDTNGSSGCGGGIYVAPGSTATTRSTIVAINNAATGPDVCGAITSQNFNLIGNNASATITNAQSSDQIGTSLAPIDPLLGPLQYNGGSTFTRAIQSSSTAVDRGDPNPPARDQRGYLRANIPDIGAFEFAGTVPVSLANISTRLLAGTGNNVLIGGFIVTGAQPKRVIVRAIGPSLPLAGTLTDPILELRDSSGGLLAVNDNWRSDHEAEIMATTIPPSNDKESAIVATLPANNSAYTAILRGVNNGTGIGVVEVYDLNRTVDSKLGNISTRGFVQTDDNVLIGGLIVVGQDPQKVIVRGIGPSLNISGKLADPTLELRDANGGLLKSNDNWRTDQEAEIIATTIPPSNDLESAIVKILTPGNYTAIVRGVSGSTGIGVVEVYGLN